MIGVALQFIRGEDRAPRIIASGEGVLGDLIKSIAEKNGVPIIKDPDLSRVLSGLPVDKEIPENLYKAVANIFQYVYKLEKDLHR
ncbi:MAG: EscU/YscU/HrcU family type III secretion system export apparatus switch protein [Leptospiraceae bacterium]|nr:EscU/YscU/HrcU family type III secretion system export apparatus switch protein [Leptospiraceae bacterium]MCP5511794.1 EscU/YscU/HrcU family type III secretion system export apparatus switch protein [Leptospiraceae bacterium]